MGSVPTYGMAGIGIAAAIGFIFALSLFNSNLGKNLNAGNPNPVNLQQKENKSQTNNQSVESNSAPSAFANGTERTSQPQANLGLSKQDRALSEARPTLASLIVLSGNREDIGELVQQMEFQSGKPVFVQARFVNNGQSQILNYTITISISSTDQTPGSQQESRFNGDINRDSGLELELYWNPATPGNYSITVFSNTAEDLGSSQTREPLTTIPVKVVPAP